MKTQKQKIKKIKNQIKEYALSYEGFYFYMKSINKNVMCPSVLSKLKNGRLELNAYQNNQLNEILKISRNHEIMKNNSRYKKIEIILDIVKKFQSNGYQIKDICNSANISNNNIYNFKSMKSVPCEKTIDKCYNNLMELHYEYFDKKFVLNKNTIKQEEFNFDEKEIVENKNNNKKEINNNENNIKDIIDKYMQMEKEFEDNKNKRMEKILSLIERIN
jgi:hypothetical protein